MRASLRTGLQVMGTLGFMAGYFLLLEGCGMFSDEASTSNPGTLDQQLVTVRVGEREYVEYDTKGGIASLGSNTCDGIAELTNDEALSDLAVDGLAVGTCSAQLDVSYGGESNAVIDVKVTVIPADDEEIPDAGAPDSDVEDAGVEDADVEEDADVGEEEDAGPTPLCVAPVGFIINIDGKDLYMAFTDVDSVPDQECPIHTSTSEAGDIVFSFLSGSPGYRIDGRGTYVILSADGATLENTEWTSSAVALEDTMITITFQKRVFPDEEVEVPPPVWEMTFQMKSDPDWSKWQVELFAFSQVEDE